jgi:hypothetical protein
MATQYFANLVLLYSIVIVFPRLTDKISQLSGRPLQDVPVSQEHSAASSSILNEGSDATSGRIPTPYTHSRLKHISSPTSFVFRLRLKSFESWFE